MVQYRPVSIPGGQTSYPLGDQIPLNWLYQDDTSKATVQFYLDFDRNPFDNNQQLAGSESVQMTFGSNASDNCYIDTSSGESGHSYYLLAKISDGTHTRYAYAPQTILLTSGAPLNLPLANNPPAPPWATASVRPSS